MSPVVCACEKLGIRIVDTRHEADAVFAADATSRLTGTIGVAIVTAGPGVTNTVTAVKNAQMAHSPMLVIGGAAATVSKGRGSLQDIEQLGLFRSCAKMSVSVDRIENLAFTVRKCIHTAQSGVPGPVFLELPIDLLYPILELKANMGLVGRSTKKALSDADIKKVIVPVEHRPATAAEYVASVGPDTPVFLKSNKVTGIVKAFMTFQLKRIFANAWVPRPVGPMPIDVPLASDSQVAKVVKLLSTARHPVIIVGSQIIVNPAINNDDVGALLTKLSIPSFLSGMARGMFGQDNPRFIRQNRKGALKDADVVLLLGVSVDFRLDYGRAFSKKSKVISVNRSKEELKRNTDVMWKPYMSICGDPSDFLVRMHQQNVSPAAMDTAWTDQLKSSEKAKEDKNAADGEHPATGRADLEGKQLINPIKFFTEMASVLAGRDDYILIGDGGDFVATAAYILRPPAPCSWLDPGPYGTLGVGGGFALAAKLAFPNKHVFLLWGDGSAGYTIAEFDAFARHKCPVIAIVGNDACWSQIVRDQRHILGSEAACNLAYCHYDTIAAGYGGSEVKSATIDKAKQVHDAIKDAIRASSEGKSTCLNVMIGKSSFREGSISV